jgi:capsular polysaccharide export protein
MAKYKTDFAVLSTKEPVKPQTRHHLFLQGPVGPFFKELATALKENGDAVTRIHFNCGDIVDWFGRNDAVIFQKKMDLWPDFINDFLIKRNITDIYIYGDCRPLHQQAIKQAKKLNIAIHVFEEGYIRPNYVTYEHNGVNANSELPKDAAYYLAHPIVTRSKDIHTPIPIPPAGSKTGWYAFRYYLFCFLGTIIFPYHQTHRHWPHAVEALSWVRRSMTYFKRKQRAFQIQKSLYQKREKYYLCLLQLTGDSQIQKHSAYKSMREYTRDIIQSFAKDAPLDTKLVFKNHPLDNGISNLERKAYRFAKHYGVEGRVVFVDGGRLKGLAKIARGVITINSTAAFSALHYNKPTIALGNAIYNMEGLTFQGGLNDFWRHAQRPNHDIYLAFRKVLTHYSQRNGNFFNEEGRELLIAGILSKSLYKKEPYIAVKNSIQAANNNELHKDNITLEFDVAE